MDVDLLHIDPDPDVAALWGRYLEGRSLPDRNALVQRYWPEARRVAAQQAGRYARYFGGRDNAYEEVCGVLGIELLAVIESYDPARGMSARSWLWRVLSYRLLDYVRTVLPLGRLDQDRVTAYRRAADAYWRRHGRQPTDVEDLAEWLDFAATPAPRYRRALLRQQHSGDISLETPLRHHGETGVRTVGDMVAAAELPDEEAEAADAAELLRGLTQQERAVLQLIYVAGYSQVDAGRLLGVSESRISQLHVQALRQLRKRVCG